MPAAALSASDQKAKESKLDKLRQRRAQPAARHGKTRPAARSGSDAAREGAASRVPEGADASYAAYPTALSQLRSRLAATPEEIAAWVFMGPEEGGLAAYVNANELDPPPRFCFPAVDPARTGAGHDYVSPLMASWFRVDDLASFTPRHRYLTGQALIERWSKFTGVDTPAYIRAKIAESRLLDAHLIYGFTRGRFPGEPDFPPLERGLFALAEIEAVEVDDFGSIVAAGPKETPKERAERIKTKVDDYRRRGVKGFLARVAEEEGLSVSRVKQFAYPKEKRATQASPASWLAPVSTQARSSPSKRKSKP